ncbi:tripartite tricarboxylate transporter substrate binding protein [Bradyrhizobium sp. LHD-71]|uniref:Bug family tripartite tricarboxylate transporter substrate binding protein n=1 Tax=Bradyrhizobium sp. LHD-71 TaxID=3072141 RepID=UPI00280DD3E9|nr:tripartite tricarboxylate transporter substrate binding protein [Bradyrhizobium sp. LHD-71]MDQ8727427.1 tripartite tricarboxylate transporter substrate binding protein [Bradyrhizobium sp. LHD-71]
MRALRAVAFVMLALLASYGHASAQYPERNVTVIVPFPAGGASDTTARLVAGKISERLNKSFVVENRAGANGALGAAALKQAAPDGYTLLVGSIGVFAINPALIKDLKYDPLKDFDLLSVSVRTPNVLVVNPNVPARTVAELISHLKANPGKITFASSGIGSSDHLTAALFWQKTRTSGLHVPYRGGGPAINDLIAGHANASFQNLGAVAQQIKAGTLRALAVTSDKRSETLPDAPTMAQAGVKDLEVYSWQAAAAPKGLPPAVKAQLEKEFVEAAKSPDVKGKFEAVGFEVVATSGEQFTSFLKSEIDRWKEVIQKGSIAAE